MGRYATFDRSKLLIKPLNQRVHDLHRDWWLPLDAETPPFHDPQLRELAERFVEAKHRGAARILMMGAHVLRAGMNLFLIDLLERGLLTHIALNGAGAIHDYELGRIGATTESVARYIRSGS